MNAKLKKAVLAAAIMSTPLAASAADLAGGGASLPAIAYVGSSFTNQSPEARFSTTDSTITPSSAGVIADGTSIFGEYEDDTGNNASYCQTGSGTGKRVLLGASNGSGTWSADGDCLDYSQSPLGFGAPTGQAVPDFAGSDAPLTADDINTFTSGPREAARTNLVQVPALGAFIALPLQLAGGYAGTPNLTTDQVCGIFAGVYRSWDQVGLSSNADPIDVVYRSDDSGTVFAFTQYLASTCNGRTIGNVTIPSNFFQTNELFEDAVPVAPAVLYAEASPASGNGGIITEVEADAWSIGFANYSNIDAENQGGNTLGYAKIDNNDPASGGSISVGTGDILIDTVLGNPGANGLPTTQSLASAGGTEEECLAVVDPAIQLTQTYPIVAFTNLLTYTENNPSATAVEDLFEEVTAGSSSLPAGYVRINSTDVGNIISNCIN